jgi:ABC-type transporter Mla subunit MlaD
MSASKEFKVGVFVIVSTSLALGGVIALGSGRLFKDTETIETSTTDSVNGLQIGSPVKYRGVPIGEVKSISFTDRYYPEQDRNSEEFDFGSPVIIRMEVRLDVFGDLQSSLFTKNIERGVTRGLRARLTSAGLTGGLFVDLDLTDPTQNTVPKLAYVPEYPFIPSAPSRLDQLIDRIQVISGNLAEVDFSSLASSLHTTIDNIDGVVTRRVDPMMADAGKFIAELRVSNDKIQKVLDDPGISETIANVEALTSDLKGAFVGSSDELREGIAEIPKMMKAAREAAERLDTLIASPRVESILSGLDDAAKELGPTIEEYQGIGRQVTDFLESESYELQQLISALRQTSQNLEQLTNRIRRDPPSLFFAEPPKQVKPGTPIPSTP